MDEEKQINENQDTDSTEESTTTPPDEKVMPFLEHLEELRQRLLKSILSIILFSIGSYFVSHEIMQLLLRPYPSNKKLIFLAPTEGFIVHIKIALFAGILLSLPVIFYQLWQFVSPGLYKKEKKFIPVFVFVSVFFFAVGGLFCYFIIIPYGLNFLLSFGGDQLEPAIRIQDYLKFVTLLILVFGAIFELPLLAYFLTRLGILTPDFLRDKRRYGIVLIFFTAAVLTPPDVFTQVCLALPLILLYEISIWVSKLVYRKQKREEDADA
ncbi:twin arginine-targeting protein translocase TatC [candidate division KSB1 bacterium 4484_87]|nr:MAG: twin arginine-targeting protein translocase TatC [candidate division KSB1 bacterium 4484_87]